MKKLKSILLIAFAVLIAVMSFVLAGCTDREDDSERELDSVEQSLVGTWKSDTQELRFRDDGTVWLSADSGTYKFEHTGSGNDSQRGKYDIIFISGGVSIRLALFQVQPNGIQLCRIVNGVIDDFDIPRNFTKIS